MAIYYKENSGVATQVSVYKPPTNGKRPHLCVARFKNPKNSGADIVVSIAGYKNGEIRVKPGQNMGIGKCPTGNADVEVKIDHPAGCYIDIHADEVD